MKGRKVGRKGGREGGLHTHTYIYLYHVKGEGTFDLCIYGKILVVARSGVGEGG